MCCWMSKSPIATSASFETWIFRSERPKTIQISRVAQGYAGYAMDTLAVVLAVLPVLPMCVGHLVPIAQEQFLQGPKARLRG